MCNSRSKNKFCTGKCLHALRTLQCSLRLSMARIRCRQIVLRVIETVRIAQKSQSGASMIEFAICSPLFFMLLSGILSYGLYFGTSHSVSQIAADAARASIAGISSAEREEIAKQHVAENITSYPLLRSTRMKVALSNGPSPESFKVAVTYDASNLPFWFFFIPRPNPVIERSAVVTNGGV